MPMWLRTGNDADADGCALRSARVLDVAQGLSSSLVLLGFAAALVSGCAAPTPTSEAPRCPLPAPPLPSWTVLGEPTLDADGRSAPISISLPSDADIVSLRVSDPTGALVCVQLESVDAHLAGAWVTTGPGDFGPYCVSCPQRVSVGVGYGLFVLPSNSQPLPRSKSLDVIVSARDCTTLLRAGPSPSKRLLIEGLFRPAAPAQRTGSLSLSLTFRQGTPLSAADVRDSLVSEVLERVNRELAAGGLRLSVASTRTLDLPAHLLLTRGDNAPLDALGGEPRKADAECASSTGDVSIPVVFAGCIRVHDSLSGVTGEPDGLTSGIPSGFPTHGRGAGIYLKDQSCHSGAAIPWTAPLLAKLLAHELGHYLGLYHSVEPDGTLDQLDDTDARNLMFHNPLQSSAQSFSRSQLEILRRHPSVRWDDAPSSARSIDQ